MIGNAILYIIIWIAVIVVGYYLICGVAKLTENKDKPGEGSCVGGCLFWIIVLGGVAIIAYFFYALGGENPSLNSPFRR